MRNFLYIFIQKSRIQNHNKTHVYQSHTQSVFFCLCLNRTYITYANKHNVDIIKFLPPHCHQYYFTSWSVTPIVRWKLCMCFFLVRYIEGIFYSPLKHPIYHIVTEIVTERANYCKSKIDRCKISNYVVKCSTIMLLLNYKHFSEHFINLFITIDLFCN